MNREFMVLTADDYLATGGTRNVYIHPDDPLKIIKVDRTDPEDIKPNNEIDVLYFNHLVSKSKKLSYIPRCYGWIETNLGKGVVFDRVINYDSSPVFTLKNGITSQQIGVSEAIALLDELSRYLIENTILFVDVDLNNLMVQKTAPSEKLLMIVDGLGSRRFRFKFWLYRKSDFIAQYKVRKQVKKLYKNFHTLVNDL